MVLGYLPLLLIVTVGVERPEDLHRLVVSRLGLQNFLETLRGILRVSAVNVHLAKAEMGQDKVGSGELGGLVVVLKCLVIVPLNVERPLKAIETRLFNINMI